MKELTKQQKKLAERAVLLLKKLQNQGVEIMSIDGGGGGNGLTFWRPTDEERENAYEIVSYSGNDQYEEFIKKSYCPMDCTGIRIDSIVP